MLKIAILASQPIANSTPIRKDIALCINYLKTTGKALQGISTVTGMADVLFCQEIQKAGIPLRITLPFAPEELKAELDLRIAGQLDQILADNGHHFDISVTDAGSKERKEAIATLTQKIVEEADILLSIEDGKILFETLSASLKNKELHFIKGGVFVPEQGEAHRLFGESDKAAIDFKNKYFQPAWISGLICGVLAVVCFGISLVFGDRIHSHTIGFALACLEVALLLISFVLLSVLTKRWKHQFLEHRRSAEYLRNMIWCADAGIPVPLLDKTDLKNADGILAIEREMASAVRSVKNLAHAKRMAWCLADEQIHYHQTTRINRFEHKEALMEKWFTFIKILFFSSIFIKFAIELMEFIHVHVPSWLGNLLPFLHFFIIVLPPVYAALEGVKYFSEWKRNIKISENVKRELSITKEKIAQATDETMLLRETKKLREILEFENSDWAVRYHENEIEIHV